jgi:ribonuclease-3
MPDLPVPDDGPDPETIERLTGQPVSDLSLYRRALTHRSLLRGHPESHLYSNERLEFLGDALLGLMIGEALYRSFPEKNEGYLTRLRAKLVNKEALALYARRLDLGKHLLMSDNAAKDQGRNNPNLLADAFEALVGAVYLDHGHEAAERFIREHALDPFDLQEVAAQQTNHKTQLQETLQADGRPQPTYHVIRETGPSHDKTFTVEARVEGDSYGTGTAGNKQQAEQQAAREALDRLAEESESTE